MENKEIEIWKDIIEFDNHYKINQFGIVIRKERLVNTGLSKTRKLKSKIKPPQNNGRGYMQIYVQINNVRKIEYIHKLVAIYFIPNPENKLEVNHINGIKNDNRVVNLEWATRLENQIHAKNNGLIPFGEKSWCCVLNDKKVLAIRRLHKINPNFNRTNMAKKLKISQGCIYGIIRNVTWKHLL